ncbi:hypothetical protein J2794_005650 [Paraburkholderia terricola]|uniref:hypothetical protein n=1 Tax=Paraburkholderia terricola TaxID=169427 RepID=UPI0028660DBB|nr:hypothetical protein [Paraburkholderia terricola]MDR6449514.1 hypothetical protein [Paraburkholderia terricola]
MIPSAAVPVVDGKYNVEQLDDIIDKMEENGTSPEPLISRPVGSWCPCNYPLRFRASS